MAEKKQDIKALVRTDQYKRDVAMALPKSGCDVDRFTRVFLTTCTKTPKLLECDIQSIGKALMDCAALGIEPDGRRAHLIPYGTTCTLVIDYKGLVELIMRSGLVSYVHLDVVCEHDTFQWNKGEIIEHGVNWKADRGAPYAAYSLVRMKDGSESCHVMTRFEIESIRDTYSQGFKTAEKEWQGKPARKDSPWHLRPYEMWKKTVLRAHSKLLPLSPECRDAISLMDKEDAIEVEAFVIDETPAPSAGSGKRLSRPTAASKPSAAQVVPPVEKDAPEPPEPQEEDAEPLPVEAETQEEQEEAPEPKVQKPKNKLGPVPDGWNPGLRK